MEKPQGLPLEALGTAADPHAWMEALYLDTSDRIFAFLRYRVRDTALAEDLTAQTFQRALERAHTYRASRGTPAMWLFTIARHVLADALRRQKARPTTALSDATPDPQAGPEELLLRGDRWRALAAALTTLSDREQLALALKYGGKLGHAQIGRVLRLPEKQVGVLLHRARQKLKKDLERRLSDED